MKSKFLFYVTLCVSVALVVLSCQGDDEENCGGNSLQNNKIELLRSKSKEFAQKYHVNVVLNEDSLMKYANVMSVGAMEEDYKAFAELRKQMHVERKFQKNTLKKGIVRRKNLNEPGGMSSGSFTNKSANSIGSIPHMKKVDWMADGEWSFDGASFYANADIVISYIVECECNSDRGCGCSATLKYCKCNKQNSKTEHVVFHNIVGERLNDEINASGEEFFKMNIGKYELNVCVDLVIHVAGKADATRAFVYF